MQASFAKAKSLPNQSVMVIKMIAIEFAKANQVGSVSEVNIIPGELMGSLDNDYVLMLCYIGTINVLAIDDQFRHFIFCCLILIVIWKWFGIETRTDWAIEDKAENLQSPVCPFYECAFSSHDSTVGINFTYACGDRHICCQPRHSCLTVCVLVTCLSKQQHHISSFSSRTSCQLSK